MDDEQGYFYEYGGGEGFGVGDSYDFGYDSGGGGDMSGGGADWEYNDYGDWGYSDSFDWEGPILDEGGYNAGGFDWEGPIDYGDAFDFGYTIGVTVEEPGMPEFPVDDPYAPDITDIFSGIEVPEIDFGGTSWFDESAGGVYAAPDITDIFAGIEVPDIFGMPTVTGADVGLKGPSIWDKIKSWASGITGGSGTGGQAQPKPPTSSTAPKSSATSMLPWLLAGGAALLLLTQDDKGKKK